jgi:hypothetical protein
VGLEVTVEVMARGEERGGWGEALGAGTVKGREGTVEMVVKGEERAVTGRGAGRGEGVVTVTEVVVRTLRAATQQCASVA